jgi:hypothetical protein
MTGDRDWLTLGLLAVSAEVLGELGGSNSNHMVVSLFFRILRISRNFAKTVRILLKRRNIDQEMPALPP